MEEHPRMRASILKTFSILALAACGLALSGCCANCDDKWQYNACDLIEGQEACECVNSCAPKCGCR